MNIYDKLNDLCSAISNSDEFIRYKNAAMAVESNPTHSAMLKDFISLQVQISTMRMFGQSPDNDTIEHFNSLYSSVSAIYEIAQFLQAQAYFSKIMDDVSKQLAKTVEVDADFLKILPNGAGSDNE